MLYNKPNTSRVVSPHGINNRCLISKILLVCCVYSLDFRYYDLVREYHKDRLCTNYSISISFVLPDIDECLNRIHACDVSANCTNTDGSHKCTCKEGYTGDGHSCQGIIITLNLANRRMNFPTNKKNLFLSKLRNLMFVSVK